MKKISLIALLAVYQLTTSSCEKNVNENNNFNNIGTPRTSSVPDELVGRWAIVSISGSTVYNVPSGSIYNTNEGFVGYQINKDGTTREDGYISTYQYSVSTWTKWSAVGTVEIKGNSIAFHRAKGSYTSSRNSAVSNFGSAEVYPNKTAFYASFRLGTDGRGTPALLVTNASGATIAYVKQ